MNLEHKKIWIAFLLTGLAMLSVPVLAPTFRLIFFAPFLVILFYQKSYIICLWTAFGCGLLMDLLSADMRLGLYGIDYCLTTGILYGQKRNFFADHITTLPLMTLFFSLLSTVILVILFYTFEQGITLSGRWILTDLIYMPLADALYAFVLFILPALLLGKYPRPGRDYFLDNST